MATGAIVPPCYDETGALQDCGGSSWCQDSIGNQGPCQANLSQSASAASGTLAVSTSDANPVANSAAHSSGSTALSGTSSLLNFFSAVAPASIAAATGTGTTTTTGLVQQLNPATGVLSYYNPATGQYTGVVPSSTGLSSLLTGGTGFIFVIVALVVAFLFFGGKKRLAAV